MIDFLNQTEACQSPCSQQVLVALCSPFDWQDGVCDESCNVEQCSYDGGDCNQICVSNDECDIYSMLNNGQCDTVCNNSMCSWDLGDCDDSRYFNLSDLNGTYCNQQSESHNLNESQLCDISWINDGWCDTNCQFSETCLNDGNDCQCDNGSPCWIFYLMFDYVDEFGANILFFDEFCDIWDVLTVDDNNDWQHFNIKNGSCGHAFEYFDENSDDGVDLNEIIYGIRSLPEFNATEIKARQIDCTVCASVFD